jgi:hypothetical protein
MGISLALAFASQQANLKPDPCTWDILYAVHPLIRRIHCTASSGEPKSEIRNPKSSGGMTLGTSTSY